MPKSAERKNNFIALKYLPRFLNKIYQTHRGLFIGNVILRLLKSLIPIAMLWVGKEIIDEVASKVSIYPNPVKNQLYIKGISNDDVNVKVVSVLGKVFCNVSLFSGFNKVPTVPSGNAANASLVGANTV